MSPGPNDQVNPTVEPAQLLENEPASTPGSQGDDKVDLEALANLSPKTQPPVPMLRTARLVDLAGGVAKVTFRGSDDALLAQVDEGIDLGFLAEVVGSDNLCLCEWVAGMPPVVVGIVQRTKAAAERDVTLKAETLTLEAEREVTIRAGRAGIKLRQDGSVEIVGSRISAVSRGLFRLVGRMLRLN